jgi:hypothetical protein
MGRRHRASSEFNMEASHIKPFQKFPVFEGCIITRKFFLCLLPLYSRLFHLFGGALKTNHNALCMHGRAHCTRAAIFWRS